MMNSLFFNMYMLSIYLILTIVIWILYHEKIRFKLWVKYTKIKIKLLKAFRSHNKEIHEKLKKSEEFYRVLYNNNYLIMFVIDLINGDIVDANEAACKFYGYSKSHLTNLKITDLNILPYEEVFEKMDNVKSEKTNHFYFKHKLASGEIKDVEVHSGLIAIEENQFLYSIVYDISERKKNEEKIKYLAFRDSLTGLYNRAFFVEKLSECIKQNEKLSILFMDLDGFKKVNDNLGHSVGDKLLQEVARRLKTITRKKDIVGRIGGDEFTLLLSNIKSKENITEIADRIIDAFKEPYVVEDNNIYISVSIGISIYPDDGLDGDVLLKNADIAMYSAKDSGKSKFKFYSQKLNDKIKEEFQIENNLRYALDKNEFFIQYQPIVDINTEKIIGAEALLRWKDSSSNFISPNKFIPIAEKNNFIIPIGEWVLKKSCEELKKWHEIGYKNLCMSVNISVKQLKAKGFVELVSNILKDLNIDPKYLDLEITESISMENVNCIMCILNELKILGVSISMDDFGTGYSSLAQLKNLYITKLKIDKSFIDDINVDENGMNIVSTIIAMAKNLNLKVVAEGVETKEQFEFLNKQGCDMIQGYLISRPISNTDFEQLLSNCCYDKIHL